MNNFSIGMIIFIIISYIFTIVCIYSNMRINLILQKDPNEERFLLQKDSNEERLLKIIKKLKTAQALISIYYTTIISSLILDSARTKSIQNLPFIGFHLITYLFSYVPLERTLNKIKIVLNMRTIFEETHHNSNPMHPITNV